MSKDEEWYLKIQRFAEAEGVMFASMDVHISAPSLTPWRG